MRPYNDWRVVRWAREHRFAVDAGIAATFVVFALLVHFHQRTTESPYYDFREPTPWTVALISVMCGALAWRRLKPIGSAVAIVVLQVTLELLEINGPVWVPCFVALYSLGAHASGRKRTTGIVAITVAVVAFSILAALHVLGNFESQKGWEVMFGIVGGIAILAVCFFVGDSMRRRRAEIADLAARADRAERERELLASHRVTEERTRIARELHDVVAHSVSVMVIQASAARRNLHRDRETVEALLGNIEDTGRQTMGELRQILGVLRDAGDDTSPLTVPMLGDIDALVGSIPELDVRLFRSGSLDSLPIGVALAAYRVVQEALTNAHRHAGPNVVVDVEVACTTERVDVHVTDDGRGASTGVVDSAGYGLIGMSERVAAFGGTLTTGPRRSGGWEVRAHFPLAVGGALQSATPAPELVS